MAYAIDENKDLRGEVDLVKDEDKVNDFVQDSKQ